jgi:Flp pilus assembly protein TadG
MRARGTRHQRGAVAIIVAIMLLVLGGFMALSLNVGHLMSVRGELQNASDSGALAGAWDLDGTADGIAKARTSAFDYAGRHSTDIQAIKNSDTIVEFGYWSVTSKKFFPISDPTSMPELLNATNAVHVTTARAGDNAAPVFFPVFLGGKNSANVGADAIAVRGGPCEEKCGLPLAFAKCQILNQTGGLKTCEEGLPLYFHSDTTDNIGFTVLNQFPDVSTSYIRMMLDGFKTDPPTCGSPVFADPSVQVEVSNGSNLNPTIDDFAFLMGKGPYPVPIMELPCEPPPITGQCSTTGGIDSKFVKSAPIVAFASVTVAYAGLVKDFPTNQPLPPGSECWNKNSKVLVLTLHCDVPTKATAGCEFFGLLPPPKLVK